MFTVFFADDEPFVLEGLKIMIDWEKLGIEIAGSAEDGKTAYDMIKELEPDIVISDICMSGMDGCELIEKCMTQMKKKPKFIMLSGYSEFEYVKKTMRYGAKHYLLKPLDPEEIQKTLEEICGEIAEDREREAENLRLIRCVEEDVFRKLFLCGSDAETVERARFLLNVPSVDTPLSMVMFRMNQHMNLKDIDRLVEKLRSEVPDENMLVMYIGMRAVTAIGAEQPVVLLREFAAAGENCCDAINICSVPGINQLKEAHRYMITNVYGSAGEIKVVDEHDRGDYEFGVDIDPDKVVTMLLKNDRKKAEETVKRDFEMMKRKRAPNGIVRGYTVSLLFAMYLFSNEMGINLEEIYNEALKQFSKSLNYDRAELMCIDLLNNFADSVTNVSVTDDIASSKDIMEYIEEHYPEHITLNDISNAVYIQPGTVSKIIKKRTGMKFSDYLAYVRIKHAQLLMANTNRKITQIASDVGYSYYYYFANRFKSITGYNPSDYRKRALNKG